MVFAAIDLGQEPPLTHKAQRELHLSPPFILRAKLSRVQNTLNTPLFQSAWVKRMNSLPPDTTCFSTAGSPLQPREDSSSPGNPFGASHQFSRVRVLNQK